ncbi:MAG: hypothetical protein D6812_03900 [Deltaproteobacteria bacterium]|nr:MAG: hypothetical protein D6812_03900 [Deltaproteobacteria bacterium]
MTVRRTILSSLLVTLLGGLSPFGAIATPHLPASSKQQGERTSLEEALDKVTTAPQPPPASPTPPKKLSEVEEKQASLQSILASIEQLNAQRRETLDILRSPEAEGQKEELTRRLQEIQAKLNQLERNFDEIATGIDLTAFVNKQEKIEIDWQHEIEELLRPLVNELRRITNRPRELDRLRTEIAESEQRIELIDRAITNIDRLIAQTTDSVLLESLAALRKEWENKRQEMVTHLKIAEQKFEQRLAERKSVSESVQSIFQLFFKSRGRNLLVATLLSVLNWLLFRKIQSWITAIWIRRTKQRTFSFRVFNVAYLVVTVIGTTATFLLVLYFFGDWVLLILSAMFLLGVLWTSKQAVPRFWTQGMLLLNMSTVREGERVMYNGLPWLVKQLNIYTHLVNPDLTGGSIRLPIQDVQGLRSRPQKPDEPWFPTRSGDWILLSDGTYGKVTLQTPEIVRILLKGGSFKTFLTADFFAGAPVVLSTGFRISFTFGLDYAHQGIIPLEIPHHLEQELYKRLHAEGFGKELTNLSVEFDEAASSSLNLAVIADFSGKAADHYEQLRRRLQRFCVEVCNEAGWIIPFTQVTLHFPPVAEGEEARLPEMQQASG